MSICFVLYIYSFYSAYKTKKIILSDKSAKFLCFICIGIKKYEFIQALTKNYIILQYLKIANNDFHKKD